MEGIVCDVCGEPAVFHSTSIDQGQRTESHMCAAHGTEVGLTSDPAVANAFAEMVATGSVPPFAKDAVWNGLVGNLRGTANIIRRYGRPPASVAELREGMAWRQGSFPAVKIADAELRETVERMEQIIAFSQVHNRMPSTREEWAQFGADLP